MVVITRVTKPDPWGHTQNGVAMLSITGKCGITTVPISRNLGIVKYVPVFLLGLLSTAKPVPMGPGSKQILSALFGQVETDI
jgi:hypothetical protein